MEKDQITQIIKYYETHSIGETQKEFNISRFTLISILQSNNVNLHTLQENIKLNQKNQGNGFKNKKEKELNNILKTLNKDEFETFYRNNGKQETLKFYKLTEGILYKILKEFSIKPLNTVESKKINYKNSFGSYEEGVKQEIAKRVKNTDYQKQKEKRIKTNLEKFGSVSPFGNKEVREKIKQTNLERYGVDNLFKSKEFQDKLQKNKVNKYGGYGWDCPELRAKTIETMQEKYGVDWGCETPQCMNASKGCNSIPNLKFQKELEKYNITFEKEFVLDNFRFDFKVDNILIEINPSYTHNSTIPYKNGKILSTTYHQEKTEVANKNNFRCIHVWDWDDVDKIIKLLLKDNDKIYARKTNLKIVNKKEEKEFLNNYHLQNYVKSEICLGLYFNDELVSLMSFGKPRYNKNYEWELLRYCSKNSIIGGSEKLFNYFLENYAPNSIISYCDLSKFEGTVYNKLNFKKNKLKSPSKHWYNIKTKQHITDNLLRERGFDQLFKTNYGKNYSNEQVMLEHGFLEIYDCGQVSYIWKEVD